MKQPKLLQRCLPRPPAKPTFKRSLASKYFMPTSIILLQFLRASPPRANATPSRSVIPTRLNIFQEKSLWDDERALCDPILDYSLKVNFSKCGYYVDIADTAHHIINKEDENRTYCEESSEAVPHDNMTQLIHQTMAIGSNLIWTGPMMVCLPIYFLTSSWKLGTTTMTQVTPSLAESEQPTEELRNSYFSDENWVLFARYREENASNSCGVKQDCKLRNPNAYRDANNDDSSPSEDDYDID